MKHAKIDKLIEEMKNTPRHPTVQLTDEQIYLLQQSAKAGLTAAAVYDIWKQLGFPEKCYNTIKSYYKNVKKSFDK